MAAASGGSLPGPKYNQTDVGDPLTADPAVTGPLPSSLEGFDEVKQRLAGWRPAEAARPAWAKAVGLSLAAVARTAGTWYVAMHIEWPVATTAVLYGTLCALYLKVGRHPDVSRQMKRAFSSS